MAIEFVNYVDGTSSAGSATAAVDLSSFAAGDVAFVYIARDGTPDPTAVPGGWSLLQVEQNSMGRWLYAKRLAAEDLASHTWTWSDANANTLAKAAVYRGCDGSAPWGASAEGVQDNTSGTNCDCGSIDTSNPWVVAFGCCFSTTTKSYNALDGWSERRDNGSTNPDLWMVIADTNGTWAGGTCAPDFTIVGSSTYRGGFLVVLNAPSATAAATMTPLRGIW